MGTLILVMHVLLDRYVLLELHVRSRIISPVEGRTNREEGVLEFKLPDRWSYGGKYVVARLIWLSNTVVTLIRS